MKHSLRSLAFSTALSVVTLSVGHTALAGFFYTETLINNPVWSDEWIYFGGCEEQDNAACINDTDSGDSMIIGDYDVKQGAYALSEPTDEHVHGKLLLNYNYHFLTEESDDNTADVGYVKVKDVETNVIYYLATFTAEDQTDDWQSVRVPLDFDLVNRQLQVVVEVVNDGERLSTMSINNLSLTHASEPVIRGTVYELTAGKKVPVEGVTIKLQNRSRTKTYAETSTVIQSDTENTYTFWPVPIKKKLVVVVSYNGEEKTVNMRKMKYGSFEADIDFTFE